ncbi:MAG: DUF1653 domain-containing protein [Lactobacillales bacterium]|jgi:hypothetical protein|nr:DUF1653 domain-containing protein [Lactobacillales bacterium]
MLDSNLVVRANRTGELYGVKIGSIYRHFKGNHYIVESFGLSSDGNLNIVYHKQGNPFQKWMRDFYEFTDIHPREHAKRFVLIED